jgi:hypothetical protein
MQKTEEEKIGLLLPMTAPKDDWAVGNNCCIVPSLSHSIPCSLARIWSYFSGHMVLVLVAFLAW